MTSTTTSPPTPIILLKSRSTPTDAYESHFTALNYNPVFIPVLTHNFNQETLTTLIQLIRSDAFNSSPPQHAGVVFTSQRAVAALSSILSTLPSPARHFSPTLPFYAVGPATARALTALALPCPILGADSGNADALAAFVRADLRSRFADGPAAAPPLLFLAGEVRREALPATLRADGWAVQEAVVYETGVREEFGAEFEEALARCEGTRWVVVFSPSGGRVVLRRAALEDPREELGGRTLIAAIGPTTRDYLIKEFGVEPDVCAAKPNPEALEAGIREFMEKRGLT